MRETSIFARSFLSNQIDTCATFRPSAAHVSQLVPPTPVRSVPRVLPSAISGVIGIDVHLTVVRDGYGITCKISTEAAEAAPLTSIPRILPYRTVPTSLIDVHLRAPLYDREPRKRRRKSAQCMDNADDRAV